MAIVHTKNRRKKSPGPHAGRGHSAGRPNRGQRLSILVADDDPISRRVIRRAIQASRVNARVTTASTLAGLFQQVQQRPPDALIVNHLLPGGDSLDVLERLKKDQHPIPVLVTTGYGSELLAVEVIRAGAMDYLPKDKISPESLSRAIPNAIELRQARNALTRYDTLLKAVAQASARLLAASAQPRTVRAALGLLGKAMHATRVQVLEQGFLENGAPFFHVRHEWSKGDAIPPGAAPAGLSAKSLARWRPLLSEGKTITAASSDWPAPEARRLKAQGTAFTLLVPIRMDDPLWGLLGFELAPGGRPQTEGEHTLLSMMATGVGSALVRRHMEKSLRESERRFRMLFDKSPDAIFVENAQGIVLDANPAACRLHRLSHKALIGRNVLELVPEKVRQQVADSYFNWFSGKMKYYTGFSQAHTGQSIPVEIRATRIDYAGKPAMLFHVRDISERQRHEAERRKLAVRLLEIQEEERKRVSSELHDHLGQLLTLNRLELGSIRVADEESRKNHSKALLRLDEVLQSIRNMAISLRPPILDDLGLEAAFETLVEEFEKGTRVVAAFYRDGPRAGTNPKMQICLYRVLQEALTNIARHASASRVGVILRVRPGEISLGVTDNGRGFNPDTETRKGGIGLLGMRERLAQCGGTLEIQTKPGSGTALIARIPVTASPSAGERS